MTEGTPSERRDPASRQRAASPVKVIPAPVSKSAPPASSPPLAAKGAAGRDAVDDLDLAAYMEQMLSVKVAELERALERSIAAGLLELRESQQQIAGHLGALRELAASQATALPASANDTSKAEVEDATRRCLQAEERAAQAEEAARKAEELARAANERATAAEHETEQVGRRSDERRDREQQALTENRALHERCAQLEATIASLGEQCTALQAQVASAHKQLQLQTWVDDEAARETTDTKAQLATAQRDLEVARAAQVALQRSLDEANARVLRSEQALTERRAASERLQHDLDEARANAELAERASDELRQSVERLERELEESKAAREVLESELTSARLERSAEPFPASTGGDQVPPSKYREMQSQITALEATMREKDSLLDESGKEHLLLGQELEKERKEKYEKQALYEKKIKDLQAALVREVREKETLQNERVMLEEHLAKITKKPKWTPW